jgi:hypothetical protein
MSDLIPADGIHSPQDTPLGEAAVALKLSAAATIADMAKDFTLFHHLSIYSWMGVPSADPVQGYVNQAHSVPEIFHLQFPTPLFRFASSPVKQWGELDSTIFGIEHKYWPSFRKYIATCGLTCMELDVYMRVIWKDHFVLDVLALEKMSSRPDVPPLVPCHVLLADGHPFSQDLYNDSKEVFPLPYISRYRKIPGSSFAKQHLESIKQGVNPLELVCPTTPTLIT